MKLNWLTGFALLLNVISIVLNGLSLGHDINKTCTMADCPDNKPCSDVTKNELIEKFKELTNTTNQIKAFMESIDSEYVKISGAPTANALQVGNVLMKQTTEGLRIENIDGTAANLQITSHSTKTQRLESQTGNVDCAVSYLHIHGGMDANVNSKGTAKAAVLKANTAGAFGTTKAGVVDAGSVVMYNNTMRTAQCDTQFAEIKANQFTGAVSYQLEGAGLMGCGWVPDSDMC